MQHERIGVAAEFGDDERHALRHQAGDERHITEQPVELRHQDAALGGARGGEGGRELRTAVQSISSFARFCLDELRDEGQALMTPDTSTTKFDSDK